MVDTGTYIYLDTLPPPFYLQGRMSSDNSASSLDCKDTTYPKKMAIQSLLKMDAVHKRGCVQLIIPPIRKDPVASLAKIGLSASLSDVSQVAPDLFRSLFSVSSVWVANSATIIPSSITTNKQVNIIVSNLCYNYHRTLEVDHNFKTLSAIFDNDMCFAVHPPLPSHYIFSDEGNANHCFLEDGDHLFSLFIYNRDTPESVGRQSHNATLLTSLISEVDESHHSLVKQKSDTTSRGAFHFDVISCWGKNFLMIHEDALLQQSKVLDVLSMHIPSLYVEVVDSKNLSLEDVISSYIFNSQILVNNEGEMSLLCPLEVKMNPKAKAVIDVLISNPSSPVMKAEYVNLSESMRSGGGPACLRLHTLLNRSEYRAINKSFELTPEKISTLYDWICETYPEICNKEYIISNFDQTSLDRSYKRLIELLGIPDIYWS